MTAVAALLRGVNVGGRASLRMADLRALAERLGHTDVHTLLQSGNIVFRPASHDLDQVAAVLGKAIADELGVESAVLVRSHGELRDALDGSPFAGIEPDGARVHLVFLESAPTAAAVDSLDPDRSPGDRFHVDGTVVHLHLPRGAATTKLTTAWLERALGVRATARNRNTVEKLVAMTSD